MQSALYLAKRRGLRGFSREQLARQANVSAASIGNLDDLIDRLVPIAIAEGAWAVVGEAVAEGHPRAARLNPVQAGLALEAYRATTR